MKRPLGIFLLLGMCFTSMFSGVAYGQLAQAIMAKFPVTKATADRTDIVTAGAVMDLKVDGLLMLAVDAPAKAQLSYKDGKFQQSASTKMGLACLMGRGNGCGVVKRTFVAGEKIWLIDVAAQSDGVQLTFLSDAIKDVRYIAAVKFPSPKGSGMSADEAIAQITQVISPEASSDAPAQQTATGPSPGPAQPPAPIAPPPPPMAEILPPPPPADAAAAPSKAIAVGQTKDEVIANYGPPLEIRSGATKTTLVYKDMKVILVKNKVADVQYSSR